MLVVLLLVKMLISVVHSFIANCADGYIPDGVGGCVVCDHNLWVAAGAASAEGGGQGQCQSESPERRTFHEPVSKLRFDT